MKIEISKQHLTALLVFCLFVISISGLWYLYELITIGHLETNGFDSLITIGFASSLTLNWHLLEK